MSGARHRAAGALACVGAALAVHGLWIPAKAALAQQLLERAWQRTQAGEDAVRPWSWADTWPVARLRVPGLAISVVVLEGASGRTLAFGPGRLAGSAQPGAPGNSVVAGHRDTHFAFLRDLAPGDALELETRDGAVRRYRVRERRVVHERDARVLEPTPRPTLTLLTCYPFDAAVPGGPLRYVVVAEPAGAGDDPGGSG